jgi:hypothetical protein
MEELRFVENLVDPEIKPVKIEMQVLAGGTEVQITATDGTTTAYLAGIRYDGTIVRYIGQKANLTKLGFSVDTGGFIKMYN